MGLPRGFSTQFWSVVAATFLGFLGIGTVLPSLAPHVRNDLGGSRGVVRGRDTAPSTPDDLSIPNDDGPK